MIQRCIVRCWLCALFACALGCTSTPTTESFSGSLDLRKLSVGRNATIIFEDTQTIFLPSTQNFTDEPRIIYETDAGVMLQVNDRLINQGEPYAFEADVGDEIQIKTLAPDGSEKAYVMQITNLPIVELNAEEIVDEPKKSCTIRVISPEPQLTTEILNCAVEYRGRFSLNFPKKSMSVELRQFEDTRAEFDAPLLGMRNDDDWILYSAYIDRSLVRNLVALELFSDLQALPPHGRGQSAVQGRLVELILNGEYHGVYVLLERNDRKLLDLQPNSDSNEGAYGGLFSAISNSANFFDFDPVTMLPKVDWYEGYEQKFPEEQMGGANILDVLGSLVQFVDETGDAAFIDGIGDRIDIDSAILYHLFVLATAATDNEIKNYFLASDDVTSDSGSDVGHEPFFFVPWDLEGTFGRGFGSGETDVAWWFTNNNLFNRLLETNVNDYVGRLQEKWGEMRANLLTEEALRERFASYRTMLEQAGAAERNFATWPVDGPFYEETVSFAEDLEFIFSFIPSRLQFLDGFIEDL